MTCLPCCLHSMDGNTGSTEHKLAAGPLHLDQNCHILHTCPRKQRENALSNCHPRTSWTCARQTKSHSLPAKEQIYQCWRRAPLYSALCHPPPPPPLCSGQSLHSWFAIGMTEGVSVRHAKHSSSWPGFRCRVICGWAYGRKILALQTDVRDSKTNILFSTVH